MAATRTTRPIPCTHSKPVAPFNSDSQQYDGYTIFMLNAQENVSKFSFGFSNT